MPPRNFNLMLFAVVISILCHFTYRNTRTASILGEAIELIEQNYVDPIDRKRLVMAAMEGVVNQLDEHSSYFAVDAYESFQDSMHQEFAGIGIYVDQPEPGTPVRVVTPLVGSPALRAGVLPNDRIVQVDGQDVSEMELADVSRWVAAGDHLVALVRSHSSTAAMAAPQSRTAVGVTCERVEPLLPRTW